MDEKKLNTYKTYIILSLIVSTSFLGLAIVLRVMDLYWEFTYLKLTSFSALLLALAFASMFIYFWIGREKENKALYQELNATIKAISQSQAIIEFDMNGIVINANQKFLDIMGYTLDEIIGRHHSLFVDEEEKQTESYRNFWAKLNRGEYEMAEFKRIGKNKKVVWLLSSYNPILDGRGNPVKVIKVASDITVQKKQTFDLEKLTENLTTMSNKVIHDSNEISIGIKQLEATVAEQVTSATQQASAVSEISTTIEQIKATAKQTLAKAKQMGESATLTSKEGEKGRKAIEDMSSSINILQDKMQQISATILSLNDKTQQISEITEAVADIAKQSKMLALNASIEAAKAGESGKGFAVVAGEVKDLAERSQQSTERVQKILQDIRHTAERAVMVTEDGTKSVDENSKQVKITGDIIVSLGNVIEETSLASMQIVSAVREESVAIDQVDLSIKEINKVTNSFSAATEQTKEAATGLGNVAASLKNTVGNYELSTH